MPKDPTRPDLIARYEALGFPSRMKFEAKHGLPQNMIGKMKMGWYDSPAARPSCDRLAAAIDAEEQAKGSHGGWAAPLAGAPVEAPPQGRPHHSDTLSDDDVNLLEELIEAIHNSQNIAEVDQCNKKLTIALLRGAVTDGTARVIQGLLSERRQSLHAKQEREEKAKAGNELTIRVVFVKGWTGGPLPGEGPQS